MRDTLNQIFTQAITAVYGPEINSDPQLQLATREEFGDYQANFALRLSKIVKEPPVEIAKKIIAHIQHEPIFKSLTPSGPGFINITIHNDYVQQSLQKQSSDSRLGVLPSSQRERVVVDYANANVAKEMHVGHIRSIVLGDTIVRVLHFLGHDVIRQSHLGDWGTQFGMLIEYLIMTGADYSSYMDLDAFYKKSKQLFDTDPHFAEQARKRVVLLQQGDPQTRKIWEELVKESLDYFQIIYDKLEVWLTPADARGESFYNDQLPALITELEQKGLVTLSDGAKVIFLDEFPIPFIIQKKDGGFLYATTDLAAAKFRIESLHADRIIYLTDARQKQHFAMLFAALKKAGYLSKVRLEHIPFGAILGADNKPFKTRSGALIRLIDLITQAEERAFNLVSAKNAELSLQERQEIAHAVGIGALKYADLRADKVKDYVFDWDKLLSFEGNTAPYLQNAIVRIRAIFRKGQINRETIQSSSIIINEPIEHTLGIKLLQFAEMLYAIADDLALHRLCDYLYDLAATYHRFYEQCPILSVEDKARRDSRLLLSDLTARVLQQGLDLLGIKALEQM